MLMSNDDVKQLMNDSYNWFFTKYRDMNLNKDSPEWDSIVSDINKLSKKYDRFHFTDEVIQQNGTIETKEVYPANELLMWCLKILEARCKLKNGNEG